MGTLTLLEPLTGLFTSTPVKQPPRAWNCAGYRSSRGDWSQGGGGGGEEWRRDFWGDGHIPCHDCGGGHVTENMDHSPSN